MDYEKLYKESLERAKNLRKDAIDMGDNIRAKQCEIIFPTLKESENERIRKALISILKSDFEKDTTIYDISVGDIIAWLEKQGHTDSIIEKAKTEKQRVIISETDGDANIDWDTRSLEDTKRLLECGLQYINRELEKQGEQEEPQVYETEYGEVITYSESEGYKVIEPKFKVGDWITDGKSVLHITKYEDDYGYELKTIDGEVFHFISPDLVKANYHLWTIKDAKKGDVLAVENMIFVYKTILASHIVSYCKLFNNKFEFFTDVRTCCEGNSNVHPATKEQRDLLFTKMKEASYEWDAEKKELNKIEQKSSWSKEDETCYVSIIEHLKYSITNGKPETYRSGRLTDWLQSLKQRIGG